MINVNNLKKKFEKYNKKRKKEEFYAVNDISFEADNGKIVGSGTHEELLKTNKIYKKLYETESLNS